MLLEYARDLQTRQRSYRTLIADDVARDTRKLYGTDAFTDGFAALRSFFEQRRAYLLDSSERRP